MNIFVGIYFENTLTYQGNKFNCDDLYITKTFLEREIEESCNVLCICVDGEILILDELGVLY